MKLSEMWLKKPPTTGNQFWLHRLNKDGKESGMRDARKYYASKQDAIAHHNHMVDANPGVQIAHHLHMKSELGSFTIKLVGKQTGRATPGQQRQLTIDQLIELLDQKGSAASAWLPDAKWEELLKLYNSGYDVKVVGHVLPKGADAKKWFDRKVEMMKARGYELFAQEENFDSLDMLFVRRPS